MNATLLNPNWGAEVVARQVAATRALLQGLGPVRGAFLKIIAEFLESDAESEEMLRQSLAAVTSATAASAGLKGEPLDALLQDKPIERSMSAFGKNLRRLRLERKLSQEQLAGHEALGLSQSSIARFESGRYRPPEKILEGLAEALQCRIADLWPEEAD